MLRIAGPNKIRQTAHGVCLLLYSYTISFHKEHVMKRQLRMCVMIAAVFAALASAGLAADKDENPTIKIRLHPAASPCPALKYQLLPPLLDRKPGNAVVQYLKAPHEYTSLYADEKYWNMLDQWIDMPLPELRKAREKEDKQYFLTASVSLGGNDMLDQLDRGARCESCDWGMPIREYDYDTMLLAEIQSIRRPARILGVRARLQVADGKYADAIHTLQTGYALGRHVAQGPFAVQCLVGAAITGIMSKQLETFVQQPGAPNLYWALASLPRPMIDCRLAFEAELTKAYLAYPELRDLDKKHYPPEQWQQLLQQTAERWSALTRVDWSGKPLTDAERSQMLQTLLDQYPEAKKDLIAKGRPAAEVEAMPVPQVVLLYTIQTYDELRDDCYKWLWLPYPEALKRLDQAESQWKDRPEAHGAFSSLAAYVKNLLVTKRAVARIDRNLTALEILEAIRMYGAAHDVQLPEKLGDITEVYIPSDPLRGEPFLYHRDGNSAILESPYPAEPTQALRYQIQFDHEEKKP